MLVSKSEKAAVFIDGGYIWKIRNKLGITRIAFDKFVEWAADGSFVLRSYFYDCLPYQSASPTEEERRRFSKKQKFFMYLESLDRFTVRRGRLEYRGCDKTTGQPIFQQKQVDIWLGLDIASLAAKNKIDKAVLVSGDSDLIPALRVVKEDGVVVRLIHGPKDTYHKNLWEIADERCEVTKAILESLT